MEQEEEISEIIVTNRRGFGLESAEQEAAPLSGNDGIWLSIRGLSENPPCCRCGRKVSDDGGDAAASVLLWAVERCSQWPRVQKEARQNQTRSRLLRLMSRSKSRISN